MSNSTISPNMNLVVPTVGTEPSPTWASDLNASLSIIDSHNHSSGQGVPIQPNGMNINADLSFASNNATALRTARFTPQVSPLTSSSPDVGCLYVSGNEIYYNDVSGGHQVQITSAGSVNAGAGSISGLPSGTASATFSAGTFVWQSATNIAANMDFQSAVFRNSAASSFGLTLQAPSLSSNLTQTLPTTPVSQSFMAIDSSGNMSAFAGVSAGITGSMIAAATITQTNMAANSIGTSQIIALNVTKPKLAALGQSVSADCGSFNAPGSATQITNFSISLTTTGRPVWVGFISSNGATPADITVTGGTLIVTLLRDAVNIAPYRLISAAQNAVPASCINFVDVGASAATHTYSATAQFIAGAGGNGAVENCKLVAYEL